MKFLHWDSQALKMMHMASKKLLLKTQVSEKFFHSEVNLLIQYIIVQDQDGQINSRLG